MTTASVSTKGPLGGGGEVLISPRRSDPKPHLKDPRGYICLAKNAKKKTRSTKSQTRTTTMEPRPRKKPKSHQTRAKEGQRRGPDYAAKQTTRPSYLQSNPKSNPKHPKTFNHPKTSQSNPKYNSSHKAKSPHIQTPSRHPTRTSVLCPDSPGSA